MQIIRHEVDPIGRLQQRREVKVLEIPKRTRCRESETESMARGIKHAADRRQEEWIVLDISRGTTSITRAYQE